MAHSPESWLEAKSMFETGKSLTVIEEATGISRGQISKKSKKEGWEKETLKDLAKREVHTIITQKEIEKEKETLNATQRKHYDKVLIAEVQSQNLALNTNNLLLEKIHNNIESGTKQVSVKVKEYSKDGGSSESLEVVDIEHSSLDFEKLAKAIQTTTDNLGITQRHAPKIAIDNTNAQQNNTTNEIVGYEVKTIED